VSCEFDLGAAPKRVVVSIYDSTGGFVTDVVGASLPAAAGSWPGTAAAATGTWLRDGTQRRPFCRGMPVRLPELIVRG